MLDDDEEEIKLSDLDDSEGDELVGGEDEDLAPIADDHQLKDGEDCPAKDGEDCSDHSDPFGDASPPQLNPELIEIEDTPTKDCPGDDFEVMKAAMEESAKKRSMVEERIKEVTMQLNNSKKLLASKYFGAMIK